MADPDFATRVAAVKARIEEMVRDPFGGQVLRDLVPRGKVITPSVAEEQAGAAVLAAVRDSYGVPAFLGVGLPDGAVVILVIGRSEVAGDLVVFDVRRPGDRYDMGEVDSDATLGELIAALDRANRGE